MFAFGAKNAAPKTLGQSARQEAYVWGFVSAKRTDPENAIVPALAFGGVLPATQSQNHSWQTSART